MTGASVRGLPGWIEERNIGRFCGHPAVSPNAPANQLTKHANKYSPPQTPHDSIRLRSPPPGLLSLMRRTPARIWVVITAKGASTGHDPVGQSAGSGVGRRSQLRRPEPKTTAKVMPIDNERSTLSAQLRPLCGAAAIFIACRSGIRQPVSPIRQMSLCDGGRQPLYPSHKPPCEVLVPSPMTIALGEEES